MIKICCVCGMGLGSGLLVKMTVERVLKAAGLTDRDYTVEVADISTARSMNPHVYVTTREFSNELREVDAKVVEVLNLFDEKEVASHLIPIIESLRA